LDETLLNHRKTLYDAARAKNPQRWSKATRNWNRIHTVYLNPEGHETTSSKEAGT